MHIPDQFIGWYFSAVKKSNSIIDAGWNRLVKHEPEQIYLNSIKYMDKKGKKINPYGFGNTSKLILHYINKL